ncbi:hypothetical protein AB6A40_002257 [Gnathostoma spinigerum]|uniref:Protein YIPF n=1 Tax=Gnathostoma spinigerum TaxID=75299 RepID=A0ABD6E641_9BILA
MSNLQFQDFSLGANEPSQASGSQGLSGRIGDSPFTGAGAESRSVPGKNFFSFQYYQQYFDVDTDQVVSRLLSSMVPRFGSNFIVDHVQPIPDLYGPFWVCVTLIFSTAICGNLARYIATSGDVLNNDYSSDFRLVTGSSTIVACYVILIPFALYSLLWYRKSEVQYSYLEIMCAYGYSLTIFIPVSVLWVVNWPLFRWLLILVSVILSGSVLCSSIWPAVRNDRSRMWSLMVVGSVLILHALLAIGFKEFYFDVSHPARTGEKVPPDAELPGTVTTAVFSNASHSEAVKSILSTTIHGEKAVKKSETRERKRNLISHEIVTNKSLETEGLGKIS